MSSHRISTPCRRPTPACGTSGPLKRQRATGLYPALGSAFCADHHLRRFGRLSDISSTLADGLESHHDTPKGQHAEVGFQYCDGGPARKSGGSQCEEQTPVGTTPFEQNLVHVADIAVRCSLQPAVWQPTPGQGSSAAKRRSPPRAADQYWQRGEAAAEMDARSPANVGKRPQEAIGARCQDVGSTVYTRLIRGKEAPWISGGISAAW
jgi:hypothetical protein